MDLTKSSPHRKPMRLRLPRIGIIRPRRASIIPQSQYPPYLPLPVTFDAFFETTTGKKPYDYQCRLACGPDAKAGDPDTLQSGAACESHLINIPTGLGKTAAVVLAWLWNRVVHPDAARRDAWPRRLVYCLPMRTLVEQTRDEITKWIGNLINASESGTLSLSPDAIEQLRWLANHSPIVLMGGEDANGEWDVWPEKPAILIGTQDMLLSRALNRGYGMHRYRWPMHFGLLNNDCLWVMDETQLMGPGLSTSAQLEAFRKNGGEQFGTYGGAGSVTWYMSATNNPEHLSTREWRNMSRTGGFEFGLTKEEKAATGGEIYKRRYAVKSLEPSVDLAFANERAAKQLVEKIWEKHNAMIKEIAGDPGLPARTLIICNTVGRAKEVYRLLAAEKPEGCDLFLLHSRFRSPERKAHLERLKTFSSVSFPRGQIVVSTQVIEAGVDVSSGILWSEIAPLASLVQRLGRLNRAGEFNHAKWTPVAVVFGLGIAAAPRRESSEAKEKRQKDNAKLCLPYELTACDPDDDASAWKALKKLKGDASPASLEQIQGDIAASIPRCRHSLQRHELLDFFDTDANLSLGHTDVSPFVRGLDDDTDLQVLWREPWSQEDGDIGTDKPNFTPDYQRDELCLVPIGMALKARQVLNHGWLWRGRKSGWVSVRDAGLAPGMTILLPHEAGGYDTILGWTGIKDDKNFSPAYEPREWCSDEEQLSSLANGWQSIAEHTTFVAKELNDLLAYLLLAGDVEREALTRAVPWHDIGKNHLGWQEAVVKALERAGITGKEAHRPFAKFSLADSPQMRDADGSAKFTGKQLYAVRKKISRYFQPEVTHEVASALAFRQAEQVSLGSSRDADLGSLLAEYVIMSHHGHVRKVLRDEIPRIPSDAKDTATVRGIAQGSSIPPVEINRQVLCCDSLSTDCRKMGRGPDGHESYTRGVLSLLEHYGPFRLAFFEVIFRAADNRASALAKSTAGGDTHV